MNNSTFATYRLEALHQLLSKDVQKISEVCGISRDQAQIKLVARLVGHDKFYEDLNRALEISESNQVAFDRVQTIKAMMFDAVRGAYLEKANEIAAKRLKEASSEKK